MTNSPVIGIDFGGTSIKMAVVDGESLISDIERIPTQDFDEPNSLMNEIAARVSTLRQQHSKIAAIGIGVPGAVNSSTGITYNLTNVKGWTEVPLRDLMTQKTGLPTLIENDANCMAYAEWKYGAAKGFRHAVCVTLGTGVGGGLILDGKLFHGAVYAAGEIGQMSIDYHGVPGPYGNTGCVERYVGIRQIVEMAHSLYAERGITAPENLSPKLLSEAAHAGDEIALELWHRVAECLGFCLMSVTFLLNPEVIVIGGGVADVGDPLFIPLRETLRQTLSDECFRSLRLERAHFGNTAGILGSSALAGAMLGPG